MAASETLVPTGTRATGQDSESGIVPGSRLVSPRRFERLGFIVIGGAIAVIAFIPRFAVAQQQAWLNDEILFVDWLGYWFSQHLLQYLLQWQHTFYPPMSPVFANPPLFIVLAGIALDLSLPLHLSPLLAVRLISVIDGTAACVIVSWIGYREWGPRAAIVAGGTLAVLPVAVVSSGSALIEGTLAFEAAILVALLLSYRRNPQFRLIVAIAILSGFGVLTKLTFLPLIAGTFLVILRLSRSVGKPWHPLAYLGIFGVTPVVLWAGARDPHHIAGVIHYVLVLRPNSGLVQSFTDQQMGLYLPLIVLGTLPDAIAVLILVGVIAIAIRWVRRKPVDGLAIILGGFIGLYAGFAVLTTGASSRHQIAAVEPLIAVAVAWLVEWAPEWFRLPKGSKTFLGTAAVGLAALPLVSLSPAVYNAYSNQLMGGTEGSLRYYASGDGEGMDLVASWINANTPPNTVIASVGQNYNLEKYLTQGRRTVPLFDYEPIDAAGARGASIVVLYAGQVWSGEGTTMSDSARPLTPFRTIWVAGAPYIYIYDLASLPRVETPLRLDWTKFQREPTSDVVEAIPQADGVTMRYRFLASGVQWAGVVSSSFDVQSTDKISMRLNAQILSDNQGVYVDLLPAGSQSDGTYLRYILPLAPVLLDGPTPQLNLEIPLSMFHWVDPAGQDTGRPVSDIAGPFKLRITSDSHVPAAGEIQISHLALVAPKLPQQAVIATQ